MDCFVVPAFIVIAILGRTVSFHLTCITKKHNYVNGQEICYRIIGMQAILANYRLTSGIGLAGIGSFSFTHRHWSSSSSFISAGQLFQPHRRTSGGFRVGGGVNAAGAMLTFCLDKILKKFT